jgi:hypothetical protein
MPSPDFGTATISHRFELRFATDTAEKELI